MLTKYQIFNINLKLPRHDKFLAMPLSLCYSFFYLFTISSLQPFSSSIDALTMICTGSPVAVSALSLLKR